MTGSISIGGRSLRRISGAWLERGNYVALFNILRLSTDPAGILARYLLRRGSYPATVTARTPLGPRAVELHNAGDLLTFNEVFFRKDYPATDADRVIVDLGANIGISGLHFLTHAREAFVHLFEPLPANVAKLRRNLRGFEARFALSEAAVGLEDGEVAFGFEETGRLGGIGKEAAQTIQVPCLRADKVIAEIMARHGRIDILKVDIEGLEGEVIRRIPPGLAGGIRRIYLEWNASPGLLQGVREHLAGTHDCRLYGGVAHLVRR